MNRLAWVWIAGLAWAGLGCEEIETGELTVIAESEDRGIPADTPAGSFATPFDTSNGNVSPEAPTQPGGNGGNDACVIASIPAWLGWRLGGNVSVACVEGRCE